MANAKMTKKDWFETLIDVVNGSDLEDKQGAVDFLNHEIELLARKSSKVTQTRTQKENLAIMEQIKDALAAQDSAVTISELQESSAEIAQYSNQKISALLRKLIEAGEVVKTMNKKKAYFSLAD